MNWFERLKTSGLEEAWWVRFYEHLSKNAEFLLHGAGMQLDPQSFLSGSDGSKLFFSFGVICRNLYYSCHIHLEFSERVSGGIWEGSKLRSLQNQGAANLLRASWFVLVYPVGQRLSGDNYYVAGKGFLMPPRTSPNEIVQQIRATILNDNQGGGGNDGDDGPEPAPVAPSPGSKRMPIPA
jgi:hypothetical protein